MEGLARPARDPGPRSGADDDGIDAVAKGRDGGFIAIQCKARGQTAEGKEGTITGEDVNHFIAATANPAWASPRTSLRPRSSSLREAGAGGSVGRRFPGNPERAMRNGVQAPSGALASAGGDRVWYGQDRRHGSGGFPYHPPYRADEEGAVDEQIDYRSSERALRGSRAAGSDRGGRRRVRGSPCRPAGSRAPRRCHGRRPREPREPRLGRGLPGNAAPFRARHPARALGVRNRPGGSADVLGRKGGTPPTERTARTRADRSTRDTRVETPRVLITFDTNRLG